MTEAKEEKVPVYVKLPRGLKEKTEALLKKNNINWTTLVKTSCLDFIELMRKK